MSSLEPGSSKVKVLADSGPGESCLPHLYMNGSPLTVCSGNFFVSTQARGSQQALSLMLLLLETLISGGLTFFTSANGMCTTFSPIEKTVVQACFLKATTREFASSVLQGCWKPLTVSLVGRCPALTGFFHDSFSMQMSLMCRLLLHLNIWIRF